MGEKIKIKHQIIGNAFHGHGWHEAHVVLVLNLCLIF